MLTLTTKDDAGNPLSVGRWRKASRMRRLFVLMSSFAFVAFLIGSTAGAAAQQAASTNAPETFNATANVAGDGVPDGHRRRSHPAARQTSIGLPWNQG